MARSAQEYAETCPVGHDSNRHRNEATGVKKHESCSEWGVNATSLYKTS